MSDFMLGKNIAVRKEWFGCLVCDKSKGHYEQLNSDAFEILSLLKKAISVQKLKSSLEKKGFSINLTDLQEFITSLEEMKIVTRETEAEPDERQKIWFENTTILHDNRLVSPASVTLYITDYCNKKCRHCISNASTKNDMSKEFVITEWEKVLSILHHEGIFNVVFTGGEPLLKTNFFEILRHAEKLGFSIALLTDYDLIDIDTVKKIGKIENLSYLQTSLDGATPKTHDYIRGKGSFEKALKRMKLLQQAGLHYTISVSVNSMNLHEIDKIVDIYHELGASYLYLNPVAPYGRAKKEMENLLLNKKQLTQLAQKYLEVISKRAVNSGNPFWEENLHRLKDPSFMPFVDALDAVSIGAFNLAIGSKGECYLDSKMKSENLLHLGNILTTPFSEIWNNPKLEDLRSRFSSNSFAYTNIKNARNGI